MATGSGTLYLENPIDGKPGRLQYSQWGHKESDMKLSNFTSSLLLLILADG